ncbi:MAG: proline dehydrogenase [Nitrospinae bacterium CG11_big_fil_rev_8_21_14_0_20_56_8]|nr:MAG: proline dehydrogenase [Nitrospinae bacterium CG11_big_fil_rev_8_21_14_0_20_56_8]
MHLLYPFAKRFIAGEDLPTAMRSINTLCGQGYWSTIDILGEHVHLPEQADAAKRAYLDLLQEANRMGHRMDFSVKLTQMGLDIDPEFCKRNVEEILQSAGNHTVRFDIEGSEHTQRIISMCVDLHEKYPNLGQALQAYLFRTGSDVENMIQRRVSVRLCKGAYKEPPSIAWQDMDDIRANFLQQAFRLLKEGHEPSIATHDEFLLTEILSFVEKEKIDPQSFYFEMLYGIRRDLQGLLRDKGYRMRIYVPYGKSWLPYTLRRLVEKKENILFVLRHLFRETVGLRRLN